MRVALVNTNRIKPPIAPIGLEYVAEAVRAAGHQVEILDLCWVDDWSSAVTRFFERTNFSLVGVTLRNTDDCAYTSRQSFLAEFADIVNAIRSHTDAFIVLGGVGFSVMPEQVLQLCQADAGVWGGGEFALAELASRIEGEREWRDLPNLVWEANGSYRRNPAGALSLASLPPMSRGWIDNARYFREGGQVGVETKRGCPRHCVYCADPIAKGERAQTRPPGAVVDEMERLLAQGVDHLHTCDSEFNIPEWHASEVCEEMVRRHLGGRLRWYAYCAPMPFSGELARLMRRAGCLGINFGVDSGDAEILRRLKRDFAPVDIVNATRACKAEGMAVMLDLLLGSPGESRDSITRTIELMRGAEPDRVGVAVGVRVYPGTELVRSVWRKDPRDHAGGENALDPFFFLEPSVAPFIFELLDELVGADRRFLFFDPSRPERNYNYNANQRLVDAIKAGHRGAYWDILRRCE